MLIHNINYFCDQIHDMTMLYNSENQIMITHSAFIYERCPGVDLY